MNARPVFSRGGPKPMMFGPHGTDLGLMVDGRVKRGLYQLDPRRVMLGRLIELPTWLSVEADALRTANRTLLDALKGGAIRAPVTEIGESKGHILIRGETYSSIRGPAVGIDVSIIQALGTAPLRHVRFFVYHVEYRLAEVWQIGWADFLKRGECVPADPPFMPQHMISVQELIRIA